jgi:hypothetical protein
MMLRTLFDEKRRKELQDAIKAGRPLAFRGKELASDWPGTPEERKRFLLGLLEGAGLSDEDGKKAFKDAAGKSMEDASVEDIERFIHTRYGYRPIDYGDIARSSKPPVIAGAGGELSVPRNDRGGKG